jgi:UDP-N-acetylmuramoyl-L-alanyl-D-glutamate--2,6-diaminopimelate ligase
VSWSADPHARSAPEPGFAEQEIAGLAYDSRAVQPGYLFWAFPGAKADGRVFAETAVNAGAVAVLSESEAPEAFPAPWLRVPHGRQSLALASRNFYGGLAEKLQLTGITGTNGKTTTSYLVDSILRAAGLTTGVFGTIGYVLAGNVLPAVNTTPESLDLHRMFAELVQLGGTHATLEVSSHALDLGRVYGLHFHTAVFSNLTRDHLDYHHTMEAYFAAKQLLFTGSGGPPPRVAVVNRDDEWARKLQIPRESSVITYGLGTDSALRARQIHSGLDGLRFEVVFGRHRAEIRSKMIGEINVYNILAAVGAGISYQLPLDVIAAGITACAGVPGRFQRVDEGQPFAVVVDYSHTDDALRNAIAAARSLNPRRVITVFGCGGDRDRTKRPVMGQVAGQGSDLVIVTSDNPRSEDPLQIINDILVGARRTDTRTIVEPDRAAAIKKAVSEAGAGDFVLLAGKGHETYQIFRDRTIHFDDRESASEALRSFGFRRKDSGKDSGNAAGKGPQ